MRTARPVRTTHTAKGYTLVELMIAVGIAVVILSMVLGFFIETTKSTFFSEQKNAINRDIRALTSEMADNAREANYFLLYRSIQPEDRDNENDRLFEGNAGDLLVLIYQKDPAGHINDPRPTDRIIIYYRDPEDPNDPTSVGPVVKAEWDVPNADEELSIEELLFDMGDLIAYGYIEPEEVVEISEGLANHRLFFNFWNRSVMINGKIVHGSAAKRITNTYNFSISPRG